MICLESVEERNCKIKQKRFGVSAVFEITTNPLYEQLYSYKNQLDKIFPNCFIWYPRWHMTLIRCKSVKYPFEISPSEKFFEQMKTELSDQPQIKLENTCNSVASDGVLRCYFSEIKWPSLDAVHNFYLEKDLQYTIIHTPWIALGNIRADRLEDIKLNMDTVSYILNKKHLSKICIQIIRFIYYEDILLQKSQCIGNAILGGCI